MTYFVIIDEREKMKKPIFISLLSLAAYFFSCTEETVLEPPYANTPVIKSTTNAFSYVLAGNSFSGNMEYELAFTSDSLAYSIVVSSYKSGSGSLTILNGNNTIVYSEPLQSNKVLAFTQMNKGIPNRIKFLFNGFSGTLTFGLAKSGI